MAGTASAGQGLARGALLSLVGQVTPLIAGALTMPFIIRRLGPEAFGFLALAWVALGYFGVFDLGLSRSTTKLVAEALGKGNVRAVPQIAWTAVTLHFMVGAGFGVVLAAAAPVIVDRLFPVPARLEGDVRAAFYLLSAALPVVVATGAFRGVLEAYRRFDLVNLVRVLAGTGNFVLPLIILVRGGGLPVIVLALVLVRLANGLAYAGMCARLMGSGRQASRLDRRTAGALFAFGGWVMVSNILAPILIYLDRVLISTLVSLAAVAYYTPPYELVSRLAVIPVSLAVVLFPTVSLIGSEQPERILSVYERSVRMMLLVMTPIAALIATFAAPLLRIWLGPEFARESSRVMQVLAVGMPANALAYIAFTMLQGLGRPDLTAKCHLIELPVYALGAWYLTNAAGITGAAVAWSLFLVLDAVLLTVVAGNHLSAPSRALLSAGARLRPAVASAGAFGVVMALVSIFADALGLKLALAGGATAAFGWLAWSRVLEAGDRAALRAALGLRGGE